MKKIVTVLVLALAASAACARKETANAPAASLSLATAPVESQSGSGRIEVDGAVVGRLEAILSSRLAAPVAEVRAVAGQTVRQGAVLVRLETSETESTLIGALSALDAARIAREMAKRNRERFEKLEARGAAASIELERTRQEEAAAGAAVAGAQAVVSRAEADRAQAVLTAPFDAVVVEKMVVEGDLATPGRPLVRLASLSGRRVEAAPGEEEASLLVPGRTVDVSIEGRIVEGRVAEIVGAVDRETRRRTVRVDLPAGVEPPVGAFARLVLPGPAAQRLLVPQRAVVARGGLELAWVAGKDGLVAIRYVRTGSALPDGRVEIRAGLKAGERVVLDPPADLEAGTRVRW